MFAFQPEPSLSRPPLRLISNPAPIAKPMLKGVWETVDGRLVRRWTKA